MNISKVSKGLLLGLALLLATSVFAANKASLDLNDPLTVNGKQVPAGSYSLMWEGAGPTVELTILQGKNVIATAPARLVDLNRPAQRDVTITKKNSDGSNALSEIQFGGKKYALSLGDESAKSDSDSGSK
jgi:hypothetical protein